MHDLYNIMSVQLAQLQLLTHGLLNNRMHALSININAIRFYCAKSIGTMYVTVLQPQAGVEHLDLSLVFYYCIHALIK